MPFILVTSILALLVTLLLTKSVIQLLIDVNRGYSKHNNTKSPISLPFFTNSIQVLKNYKRINSYLHSLLTHFKTSTVAFKIFHNVFILSTDTRNIQHVLKDKFNNYEKGELFKECFNELFGIGIFGVDGQEWVKQRKVGSLIFSGKNFREFFVKVFKKKIVNLCDKLREIRDSKPIFSGSEKSCDLQELFYEYTLESFLEIGFSSNVNSLFTKDEISEFARAFNSSQKIINQRFFNPFWKLTEFLDGSRFKQKRDLKTLDYFVFRVVDYRKQEMNEGDEEKSDLLSLFMKKGYNDPKELRDLVLNFIIAGRDTTAQALTWTFHLLLKPDNRYVMDKVKQEVIKLLKPETGEISLDDIYNITYDEIKELAFCKAVIQETLRLYPSVPKQVKVCLEDDLLPDGTEIKKGEFFCYSSWCMGRSDEIWDEWWEFRPERFIEEESQGSENNDGQEDKENGDFDENKEEPHEKASNIKNSANILKTKNISQFKYLVFNAGPRVCLGMNMAYTEAVLALICLCFGFDFELAEKKDKSKEGVNEIKMGLDDDYEVSLTLGKKGGLQVKVK